MKLWCVTGAMASSISYRRHQVCAEFEKILSNAGGLLCMHLSSDQILIRQRKLISWSAWIKLGCPELFS